MRGEKKLDKYKIKPLTLQQILISLDRLTRFKPTEDKYLRVFKDIITSNLISPKFKKSELAAMDYEELTALVEEILKFSLINLGLYAKTDYAINKKLLKYEKSVFKFDKEVEKLVNNKINYEAAIKLLEGGLGNPPYCNDNCEPLNLQWLKSLNQNDNQTENRANFGLKFPVEKLVLVEGITEEILLPKFALKCGVDFDKEGINLISAGGKNQVVKLFYQYAEILKLPIFVLLDKDGAENYKEIKPKLREIDKVHVLSSGEFEDLLPLNLIKRTLNKHPLFYNRVSINDLRKNLPMTQILEEIFKSRGLEFKKAEFAAHIEENILSCNDISQEILDVILEIKN